MLQSGVHPVCLSFPRYISPFGDQDRSILIDYSMYDIGNRSLLTPPGLHKIIIRTAAAAYSYN